MFAPWYHYDFIHTQFLYFFFSFSLPFSFFPYPEIFPAICDFICGRARTLASGPRERDPSCEISRLFNRDKISSWQALRRDGRFPETCTVTEVAECGLGKFILPSGLHQVNIKSSRCDVGQHRAEVRKLLLLLNREPESVILIQEGVVFDGKRVKVKSASQCHINLAEDVGCTIQCPVS
jgi:hypothetical protein